MSDPIQALAEVSAWNLKHQERISELERQLAEAQDGISAAWAVLHPLLKTPEQRDHMDLGRAIASVLAEAQAQMGAMREVLDEIMTLADTGDQDFKSYMGPELFERGFAALAPEAGKELLARLDQANAAAASMRTVPVETLRRLAALLELTEKALNESAIYLHPWDRAADDELAALRAELRALAASTSPDR